MTSSAEIDRLQRFHALHFPNQGIPNLNDIPLQLPAQEDCDTDASQSSADGLGNYEDGVKRTLTTEQVEMFRHSEIQRLLNERRAAREKEEKQKRRQENKDKTSALPRGKRRFEDQPKQEHISIDALVYDHQPNLEERTHSTSPKFLWPTLGRG